ncbi:MAG: hypothetical protein NZ651_01140 [Candidatus Bipolaricaulota bacterium]|nr:hypothetical protein [Candidatus Bipolaricaulota bacterium]MDW8126373.1 hypothetical protein [Candidatus Bipolaricaulota bacterium]
MRLCTRVLGSPSFLLFAVFVAGRPPTGSAFLPAAFGAALPEANKPGSLLLPVA